MVQHRMSQVAAWLFGALIAAQSLAAAPPSPPEEGSIMALTTDEARAADSLYRAGLVLYEGGKFVDAAHLFASAAEKAPKECALQYNAAKAFDKAGDRKTAIDWYRRFLSNNPTKREGAIATARLQVLEREQTELANPARSRQPSLPFVEPVTKHTFQTLQTFDNRSHVLLGVGARKVMGFRVYAMALYVEEDPARQAFPKLALQAGGADRQTLLHSDLAYKFVVLGEFSKAAMLHFVRDVAAKDTRKAYRESLLQIAGGQPPSDLQRDIDAFLLLFDDVKEGQDVLIRTSKDGDIVVEAGGQAHVGPKSPRLAHDLWAIWLGEKPIASDLKKTVLDRIETLGR